MSELASVMFDGRCFETEVAQKLAVSHITFARSRLLTCVVFIFAFFPTGFFERIQDCLQSTEWVLPEH